MAITEVPRKIIYTCDRCSGEKVGETTYPSGRPPGWATFKLDWAPSAEHPEVTNHNMLVCDTCAPKISSWVVEPRAS